MMWTWRWATEFTRWHQQRSASTPTEGWRPQVSGLHWLEDFSWKEGCRLSPTFDLQRYPLLGISSVVVFFIFAMMMTEAIQLKHAFAMLFLILIWYQRTLISFYAEATISDHFFLITTLEYIISQVCKPSTMCNQPSSYLFSHLNKSSRDKLLHLRPSWSVYQYLINSLSAITMQINYINSV